MNNDQSIKDINNLSKEELNDSVASNPEEDNRKAIFKNFNKRKFLTVAIILGSLIVVVLLITGIVWARNVYNTYKNAEKYKPAYEKVKQEKEYCNKIQNTSQPKENFIYCDKFMAKFNDVNIEE